MFKPLCCRCDVVYVYTYMYIIIIIIMACIQAKPVSSGQRKLTTKCASIGSVRATYRT